MQFLSENRLKRCKIFGCFGFLTTESEPNFGFCTSVMFRPKSAQSHLTMSRYLFWSLSIFERNITKVM